MRRVSSFTRDDALDISKLIIIATANILLAFFIGLDASVSSVSVGVPEMLRNIGFPVILFQIWATFAGVMTILAIITGGRNPNGIHISALLVYVSLGLYASIYSDTVPNTIIATYGYVFLDLILSVVRNLTRGV